MISIPSHFSKPLWLPNIEIKQSKYKLLNKDVNHIFLSNKEGNIDYSVLHDIYCTDSMSKQCLGRILIGCLQCCFDIFRYIINESSSDDFYSYIFRLLLNNQSKLTQSILYMSNKGLYGQSDLMRSILEIYVTIGWLSDSHDDYNYDNFMTYLLDSMLNSKKFLKKFKERGKADFPPSIYSKLPSEMLKKLQHIFNSSGFKEKLFSTSNNKLKNKYSMPGVVKRAKSVPNSDSIKYVYKSLCDGMHSSFSDIILQKPVNKSRFNKAYQYNISVLNYTLSLLKSTFDIIYKKHIFYADTTFLRKVYNSFLLLSKDSLIIIGLNVHIK